MLVCIYPDTDFKASFTFNFVLSLSLLHCPSLMFNLLVIILKPRVHLKYHVAVMGNLLHDCSYYLMLSVKKKKKKCVLKDSLSTIIKIMLCWLRTLKQITVFPKFKQPANFFFIFMQVLETLTKFLAYIILTRSLFVTKMFDFGTKPPKCNDLLNEFYD